MLNYLQYKTKSMNKVQRAKGRLGGNMREENSILFWGEETEMRWSIGTRIGDYTLRTMKTASINERIRRETEQILTERIRSGRKVEFEMRVIVSSLCLLSHRSETQGST